MTSIPETWADAIEDRLARMQKSIDDINAQVQILREEFDEIDPPVTIPVETPKEPEQWEVLLKEVSGTWAGAELTYSLAVSSILGDFAVIARGEVDHGTVQVLLAQIVDVCNRVIGDEPEISLPTSPWTLTPEYVLSAAIDPIFVERKISLEIVRTLCAEWLVATYGETS